MYLQDFFRFNKNFFASLSHSNPPTPKKTCHLAGRNIDSQAVIKTKKKEITDDLLDAK